MVQTYFLGANGAQGFCSCYGGFCAGKDDFLYVIKSGPGSGKSTFLRKLRDAAAARGLDAQSVLCSGDPDSLDGVYISSIHLGVVDGTAPHVIEPVEIGASALYLDFSRFYDLSALRNQRERLRGLFDAYRAKYADAYRSLAAFKTDALPYSVPETAICRFNTAICCRGILRLANLTDAQFVTDSALRELAKHAEIVYRNPLFPALLEGVVTPDGGRYRTELTLPDCIEATTLLAQAKQLHDVLEEAYHPYIDFEGLSDFTEKWIENCFLRKNDVQ